MTVALGLAALILQTARVDADVLYGEQIGNGTGQSQSQLTVILGGDVTANIDEIFNPFGVGGSVSTQYSNAVDSTLIAFGSPTPIAEGSNVTFGFSDTIDAPILGAYWGVPQANPSANNLLPDATVSVVGATGANTQFLTVYLSLVVGTLTNHELVQLPVPGTGSVELTIGNDSDPRFVGAQDLRISGAAYNIDQTALAFGEKDHDAIAPPGALVLSVSPDGTLSFGQLAQSSPIVLPEPSCRALVVMAVFGLSACLQTTKTQERKRSTLGAASVRML
jgi:hypothetical protein